MKGYHLNGDVQLFSICCLKTISWVLYSKQSRTTWLERDRDGQWSAYGRFFRKSARHDSKLIQNIGKSNSSILFS